MGIDLMPVATGAYFSQLRFLFRALDMLGMFNAAGETMYFVNVLLYKTDGFTVGKLLGKILKVAAQFKLMTFTGNQNYLFDSPLSL